MVTNKLNKHCPAFSIGKKFIFLYSCPTSEGASSDHRSIFVNNKEFFLCFFYLLAVKPVQGINILTAKMPTKLIHV